MDQSRNLGVRFWAEAALAAVSGFLLGLTLVWRDWIEEIFGVDPDNGSGALEWAIVVALVVTLVVSVALARTELRRRRAALAARP
jgi:hypothetical protein